MRMINWFFFVSTALFIAGIGFIIAGARAGKLAPAVEAAAPAAIAPVATVRQIMGGIVAPSATVIFDSVGTIVDASGINEKQPQTDEEWAAVGNSAAAIAESASLLSSGDRAVDRQEWIAMAKAMADAGMTVLKATEAKDPQGILAAGETLNTSCDSCHEKYWRQ